MESNDTQLALHDQLLAWFETHKKQVLWGASVLVAVGFVAGIIISLRNAKENNANEALSKLVGGEQSAERQDSPEAIAAAMLKLANDYLTVAKDYPNTAAGARAQLLGAKGLFSAGKYPEAKTEFEKYLKDYRDTPFANQAQFGRAVCINAQGQTNDAVAAFNDVVKRYSKDFVALQARLNLAQIYESQAKWTQARDLYNEILQNVSGNTSVGSEAGFRLQNLMSEHPELIPARPSFDTMTNAPAASVTTMTNAPKTSVKPNASTTSAKTNTP